MPTNLVGPGKRYSEKAWGQAKDLASESYSKPGPDASDAEKAKYWGTVNKITKNIQGAHGRKGRSAKKQEADMEKKAGGRHGKERVFWQGFCDRLDAIAGPEEKTALINERAAEKAEEVGRAPDARSMAKLIRGYVKGGPLQQLLRYIVPALALGAAGVTGGAVAPLIGGSAAALGGGGLGALLGLGMGHGSQKAKEKKRQGALDEALQYTGQRAGLQRGELAGGMMGQQGPLGLSQLLGSAG